MGRKAGGGAQWDKKLSNCKPLPARLWLANELVIKQGSKTIEILFVIGCTHIKKKTHSFSCLTLILFLYSELTAKIVLTAFFNQWMIDSASLWAKFMRPRALALRRVAKQFEWRKLTMWFLYSCSLTQLVTSHSLYTFKSIPQWGWATWEVAR